MLTCKIAFPTHVPHPILSVSKVPDFGHFISLEGMIRFCRLIKYKNSIFRLGCWLLPEKCSVCPEKNNGFA